MISGINEKKENMAKWNSAGISWHEHSVQNLSVCLFIRTCHLSSLFPVPADGWVTCWEQMEEKDYDNLWERELDRTSWLDSFFQRFTSPSTGRIGSSFFPSWQELEEMNIRSRRNRLKIDLGKLPYILATDFWTGNLPHSLSLSDLSASTTTVYALSKKRNVLSHDLWTVQSLLQNEKDFSFHPWKMRTRETGRKSHILLLIPWFPQGRDFFLQRNPSVTITTFETKIRCVMGRGRSNSRCNEWMKEERERKMMDQKFRQQIHDEMLGCERCNEKTSREKKQVASSSSSFSLKGSE